jgi:hypothetical protein
VTSVSKQSKWSDTRDVARLSFGMAVKSYTWFSLLLQDILSSCNVTHPESFAFLCIYHWNIKDSKLKNQSRNYATTDGQLSSLSWWQAPMWVLRTDTLAVLDCCGLVDLGTLSDCRMGLRSSPVQSFQGPSTCRTGDRILLSQNWYFSNLQSQASASTSMSARNRVVQFYPQALGSLFVSSYDSQCCGGRILTRLHKGIKDGGGGGYFTTDGRSICLGIEHPYGTCDKIFLPIEMLPSEICGHVSVGRLLWREDGSAICSVITHWSESLKAEDGIRVTFRLTVSQSIRLGVKPRNFFWVIYVNWVRTSQETHHFPATMLNRSMLLGNTTAIYCVSLTKYILALCSYNAIFDVVHIVTTGL